MQTFPCLSLTAALILVICLISAGCVQLQPPSPATPMPRGNVPPAYVRSQFQDTIEGAIRNADIPGMQIEVS
ncbi:MAG TPA: serine hydrolase, partial [Methanoregula sp.]|nr:serine hydrolase [Methanoregula sp.]